MTGPYDPNEGLPEDDLTSAEKDALEDQLNDILYPDK